MKKQTNGKPASRPQRPASELKIMVGGNLADAEPYNKVLRDPNGNFFLGGQNDSGESTKPVTASEALLWFSGTFRRCADWDLGGLHTLCHDAATTGSSAVTRKDVILKDEAQCKENQRKQAAFNAAAREKHEKARVKLTVDVGAEEYGMLCAAGVVHGCSPEEALTQLICGGDMLTNWANDGYPLGTWWA